MSKRTPIRKEDCSNGHFYSLLLSSPIPPSSPPFLSPSWQYMEFSRIEILNVWQIPAVSAEVLRDLG